MEKEKKTVYILKKVVVVSVFETVRVYGRATAKKEI